MQERPPPPRPARHSMRGPKELNGRHWKRKRKLDELEQPQEEHEEVEEAKTMIDLSRITSSPVGWPPKSRPDSVPNYQSACCPGGRSCCSLGSTSTATATPTAEAANQRVLFKCLECKKQSHYRESNESFPSVAGSDPTDGKKANAQVKCQVPTKLHHRGQQRQPQLQVIVNQRKKRQVNAGISTSGGPLRLLALLGCLVGALSGAPGLTGQNLVQSDPRPTIYSGQVSFGLLLSAHSTLGAELTSSASQQIMTTMQVLDDETSTSASTQTTILVTGRANATTLSAELAGEASESHERRHLAPIERRQIFDRSSYHVRRQKQQQQQQPTQKPSQQVDPICGQVNPGALYAGMGAIWASHQANLVGDSQLSIGTYIYDSCNDLDVGQRQSVRIVSNLNAFQQTTCESPRGSPISITIAHGDNQLRAIQLLTSFRVPVVTTKEHFALEDYSQLSRDQRKFLFSTAASSRHLAVGALRFTKRVVSRSISSPKLPNQFHKLSSKNGLIVISRNLPAKFIVYLQETIPNHVNYEMLQSSQPIDQVRSLESLESILVKSGDSTGSSHTSGASAATGTSESHPEPTFVQRLLAKRSTGDPSGELSGDSDNSGNSDEPAYEQEKHRMLSPTILMFITPAEAIDLITRLRNDLAEVSKYYSLIVSTREDISPALRTIFHRGGSRLCSGKAFYTISPVSEDISEFSRYFRDTVQMEGDSSDHPLVCDFAKFQASSKVNADLDDVATEPVIKAVWTAAAAFKSVYRRECSSLASLDSPPVTASTKHSRQSSQAANGQQQNNKSAHAECLVKMNKNMSNLVQKALRRLDVTINSTGLQALDGFRIKFDEMNELMTNKFSIKYINKECEIIEIGQFTGFKDSALRIDEDTLLKSLESTLPDAWPVTSPPAAVSPSGGSTSTTVSGSTTGASSSSSSSSAAAAPTTTTTTTSSGGDSNAGEDSTSDANGDSSKSEEPSGKDDEPSGGSESADRSPSGGFESAMASQDSPKRRRSKQAQQPVEELRKRVSRLEAEGRRQQRRQHQLLGAPNAPIAPIAATTARGTTPGLTDSTETTKESPVATTTTTRQPNVRSRQQTTTGEPQPDQTTTQRNQMRKLKPFPNGLGVTLKDWLPKSTGAEPTTTTTRRPFMADQTRQVNENEHVEPTGDDLRMKGTTQAPIFSTLPESGGNTDLEMPTTRNSNAKEAVGRSLDTAASTTSDSSDYVTSPSIVQHQQHANNLMLAGQDTAGLHYLPTQMHNNSLLNQTHRSSGDLDGQLDAAVRVNYMHDINTSPTPLLTSTWRSLTGQPNHQEGLRLGSSVDQTDHKSGRIKLRWIYGSWFTLTILGANICGALLTLYVLTFLLMKNCDGSLDRENQGIRSMHLLAIIVVFFGSTLFIVYPTPGLCLLRTSWHNFAMVLIFSSLLLQTMQVRASGSLGLGGRPNRLNQFLTLLFMVGVQVSYELQRWRYESANYVNFVNQYFGSSENGDKKLMIFSSTIANQFNPLNSFNDQVTPVSIQVSEKYQSLLQDYCSQPADDFLQSQVYLCSIIGLLVVFSVSTRRIGRLATSAGPPTKASPPISKVASAANGARQQHKLSSKSSNHHRHLHKRTGHFADLDSGQTASFASQFASNVATNSSSSAVIGNVFMVTLISAPIYFISVVLHVHGQSLASHDIIFSLAMVSIAFTTLIGIFMPILHQVNQRFDGGLITSTSSSSSSSSSSPGDPLRSGPTTASLTKRAIMSHQSMLNNNHHLNPSPTSSSAAFAMFPEFAPTGLRRPSSISGESSGGSRRPFADTKESRRNMSVNLANLGPSVDSLRHLGLSYNAAHHDHQEIAMNSRTKHDTSHLVDPGLLNLKLNLTADDEMSPMVDYDLYKASQGSTSRHNHHHHQQAKKSSSGEKRLIMLDVDPCCPRHGVAAWSTRNSANCSEGQPPAHHSKGCPGDQQLHYRPTDRTQ